MKYRATFTNKRGEVFHFIVESDTLRGAITLANKAYFDDRQRPRNFKKTPDGFEFPSINLTCKMEAL